MKKNLCLTVFFALLIAVAISCKDEGHSNFQPFDPGSEIEVTSFYPDSGGIATPIVIDGKNFGSDTTGMTVFFVDTLGVKHKAGLVSSNGSKIYAFVPKMTYLEKMKIMVERVTKDGKTYEGEALDDFIYKTQIAVTTVVGKPEPGNGSVPTVGGNLSSSTLSMPFALTLDDEDNIFIVERSYNLQGGGGSSIQGPRNEKGEGVNGNIVMADLKDQSVVVLQYGANLPNAPAFSDEEGNEAIYVPEDAGMYYNQLLKSLTYTPRRRAMILDEETKSVIENNWKYSFVVNKNDKMVYTVMYNGQLVRFNPITRNVELLLTRVMPDRPAASGANGSNAYCVFSPVEPNMLYICLENYNIINRVDVSQITEDDKHTYRGDPYAGLGIVEGPRAGRGWEDGLLESAKFKAPKQLAFTSDGKLYIADTGNHCIRVIDTTVPRSQATVSTAIGLPESSGFQDGGPEFAKFNCPTGVAVSADGADLYVSDSNNHVIRKLSIE